MFKIITKAIILLAITAIFAGVFYWRGINSAASKIGGDIKFSISKGETVKEIAANLKKKGLISSKIYFKIYVWQKDYETKLQAGEYVLSRTLTIKEVAKSLANGEILSRETTVKIIEGWNAREIAFYFEKSSKFSSGEFLKAVGYAKGNDGINKIFLNKYDFLSSKPPTASLEGYLFPDTYRVFKDATVEEVVEKMLNNFDNKLSGQTRSDINKQGKKIYEIITMASLLEKEVKTEEDMKIVSGIFWDRIKNGQALESCATLAYILGENKPQYSLEDTKINSPYNTYQNRGLPPGPISNPGLKAIRAAIYPTYTDYNYFLSDPATGKTIFSKTFAEHNANKVKYLK